jgi:protein gp37
MAMSDIEWTGLTWNPIAGCDIVSAGCKLCYAMRQAARMERMNPKLAHYHGLTKVVNGKPVWTGKIARAPESTWAKPLRRKKPTTWFVNSMSDLFHADIPDEWIDEAFAIMAATPQHTYQILTKRAERMQTYALTDERIFKALPASIPRFGLCLPMLPLPWVWLGVSAERQQEFDARWSHLEATPAAVRFISYEPMLGPLDLGGAKPDWLIAGCESGSGARSYETDWVRSIRDQCQSATTAFFFKQAAVNGRVVSLPEIDGRQWVQFPV